MFPIYEFEELPSTNDHAKQHYGEYEGCCVIWAKRQTKGRGRFLRVWESAQDLTFSILFPCFFPHMFLAPLSVVIALRRRGKQAGIKWPNDVLCDGKKICGILIEQVYEGERCAAQIVGIGINTCEKKGGLETRSTWIDADRKELLLEVLEAYEELMKLDQRSIMAMYERYHLLKGRKILLDDVLWTVAELSEEGYLRLYHGSELRVVKSGEISFHQMYGE